MRMNAASAIALLNDFKQMFVNYRPIRIKRLDYLWREHMTATKIQGIFFMDNDDAPILYLVRLRFFAAPPAFFTAPPAFFAVFFSALPVFLRAVVTLRAAVLRTPVDFLRAFLRAAIDTLS